MAHLPRSSCSLADLRAPCSPNWLLMPSTLCVELMFFTSTIWKQVAVPWREEMVDQARKNDQI